MKIIERGNEILKEILEGNPGFAKIEQCIDMTRDVTSVDVETISSCASQMTAWLANLAGVVPKYTSQANGAYLYRKFSYAWEFTNFSNEFSVKDRESKTLMKTREHHENEQINRYVADYLKNKYEAYERHVSVLQSRLGILRNEMFRSNE
jgi:hypothetical protein